MNPQAWAHLTEQDEDSLVHAIKDYLLTDTQIVTMHEHGKDVRDILNGRIGADAAWAGAILEEWNAKLGWHEFLSECYL